MKTADLAAEVFAMLGHGWRRENDPITVTDVHHELYRLAPARGGGHAQDHLDRRSAGPLARSLLPGVPLLADLV